MLTYASNGRAVMVGFLQTCVLALKAAVLFLHRGSFEWPVTMMLHHYR
jgi:hypothetical protein